LIKRIAKRGIEFAVHGYVHTDYSKLSKDEISNHIQKAVKIFQHHGIPYKGFRSPYLRWNEEGTEALGEMGFTWSSNQTILWDTIERNGFNPPLLDNYEKAAKNLYRANDPRIYPSLPHRRDGVIEIPVSLPDDEMLVDRLELSDHKRLTQIWCRILDTTYQRGELFVIQLHHERIPLFSETLNFLLEKASNLKPKVWVASLNEIANWWEEKRRFNVRVTRIGEGYQVEVDCSERTWVMVKHKNGNASPFSLQEDTSIHNRKRFRMSCPRKPIVGIPPQASDSFIEFLTDEGFPCEKTNDANDYAIYLGQFGNLEPFQRREILGLIEKTPYPLLRFWRWPKGYHSALTVTGDIDCITLTDFFLRPFEI